MQGQQPLLVRLTDYKEERLENLWFLQRSWNVVGREGWVKRKGYF